MGKDGKQCEFCSATSTPIWRRGPNGKGTLCNACGVKWGLRQRQGQGAKKRSIPKKSKSGEVAALSPLSSTHASRPLQIKPLPHRRSKDAALLQFLEFEKNSSNEELVDGGTPVNTPEGDFSEGESELPLLEHLLFVAESKFMKERELTAVRSQLSVLETRILNEVEERKRMSSTRAEHLLRSQSAELRHMLDELTLHRLELNQRFQGELQILQQLSSLPPPAHAAMTRIAQVADRSLQLLGARIQDLERFGAALSDTNHSLNQQAAAALTEVSQLHAILPPVPVPSN